MFHFSSAPNRRGFLTGAASLLALTAAGCSTTFSPTLPAQPARPPIPEHARLMYRAMPEEDFSLPAIDLNQLDPIYYRQVVDYPTTEAPGTIVVDTPNRFLYHVQDGDTAMRYGVGIGRAGFAWGGLARIAYGRKWPTWTPPAEMIERQPELEQWRGGQPPGLTNPLGARALYIHQNNRDTLYRLHGTGEVWSIGKAVSSGCVRLLHQDVIDLYDRVAWGSKIVVLQEPDDGVMPLKV
ncbi:L,D-transpeptidase [Pelagibacterium halotolerans]|uniref:L,D-transpeptidase n=1 Tax=Pelagibacterium halotolerans TaxID=531813 RepID=UPI00384CA195